MQKVNSIIKADNLKKNFDNIKAVNKVSFKVKQN